MTYDFFVLVSLVVSTVSKLLCFKLATWGKECEWLGNEWGWSGKRCFTEHSPPWWRTFTRGPFTETNASENPMDTGDSRERHMVFTLLRRRRTCPRKKFIHPWCEQIGNPRARHLTFRRTETIARPAAGRNLSVQGKLPYRTGASPWVPHR
jgi:hypothetical protein